MPLSTALLAGLLVGSQAANPYPGAALITGNNLRAHLEFFADDLLEGRDTPSRGLDIAALYLVSHLKQWGVKPAGENGTYFQKFAVRRPAVKSATLGIGVRSLNLGSDFYAWQVPGRASGGLAYVGYGWRIPTRRVDPYAGINVQGKILVVEGGWPANWNRALLNGPEGKGAASPYDLAAKLGATGVLVLPSEDQSATFAATATQMQNPTQWGEAMFNDRKSSVPVAVLNAANASALFEGERQNWDALRRQHAAGSTVASFEFAAAKTASLTVAVDENLLLTQNVVARIDGTDPVLKNEFVAIGAHYDHIGLNMQPGAVDKVYNGADDDGSGSVSTLALAQAFALGPKPKRSILFVWHAGEEKGLWGSEYFTDNPTVPLNSIITQLNIDMVGRSKAFGDTNPRNRDLADGNSIYVIGSKKMSDDLFTVSERTNNGYLKLRFDYKYDDPNDPEGFFFRSDHFNYAKNGIPIIFYFNGVHEDYHQLGDEVSKIDFVRMEKVARTVYATAWNLAMAPQRPRVVRKI